MSRLQFFSKDDSVFDQPGGLPVNFGARAYDPTAGTDDGDGAGHSGLTDACAGDWSWKPHRYSVMGGYRLNIVGPRCTCTLREPVGTNCARHA